MQQPPNFNDKIEKLGDRVVYWHSRDLWVVVQLIPHPKTASTQWDKDNTHPYGNLVVHIFVAGDLVDDERILMVKLPHHVHEYNTTWDFVSQRAIGLAHDAAERTIQRLWGVMLK